MAGITLRKKTKGVDICASKDYCYIIRSDLGCYMKAKDFNKGSDLSIHDLHPSCQHGDHYIANESKFYIIKGDEYRRVTDLTEDTASKVYTLPPKCRGGDHYLGAFGKYYIIFQREEKKGEYRITTGLKIKPDSDICSLDDKCRDGLYYWGDKDHFYFLKPTTDWGLEYYKGTSLNKDKCTAVFSVHPDVVNFLPGGLSITNGPAFGRWVKIKTVSNDSPTPVSWQKKITKRVGYNKEKMSQITKHWKIAGSASITLGKLAELISNAEFSFTAEYGRSRVNTDKETWTEETEEEEQLSFQLNPNARLYLWQFQLGLGSEPVLFCRDLKITDKPNPPTEVPLPPVHIVDPPTEAPEALQVNTSTLTS